MKKKLLSILSTVLAISSVSVAQLPNNGFENWYPSTICFGDYVPTGYSDALAASGICYSNISKSTHSHSGNYSVCLSNTPYAGMGSHPAVLVSGNIDYNNFPATGTDRFHLNSKPISLNGNYALATTTNDTLYLYVTVYSGNTVIARSTTSLFVPTFTNSIGSTPIFSNFNTIITYSSAAIPDSASTYFTFEKKESGVTPNVNSIAYLDDINFSTTTSISENIFSYIDLFPNPTSNFITINLNNAPITSIDFLDISGKSIYNQNIIENNIKKYIIVNTSEFTSGIYFAKFTTKDGQVGIKKISIVK